LAAPEQLAGVPDGPGTLPLDSVMPITVSEPPAGALP
jgi:hypothetical protein